MSSSRRGQRLIGLILAFGLSVTSTWAHGPLDNSANLTLGAEQVEVTVILGPDVAMKFFADHLPGVTRPQPVGMGLSLPADAAGKMFSLLASNQNLLPLEFRVLTDGLEYAFVARYRGTGAAAGQFHAHYFGLNDQMPPGALRVQTDQGVRLSEVTLSRASPKADFAFGSTAEKISPDIGLPELSPPEVKAPVGLTNALPVATAAGPKDHFAAGAALALMAALAAGFLLGRRRS